MTLRALGVYRESEFSPGKIGADAAILDAVLANLAAQGVSTSAAHPAEFINTPPSRYDLILAMCQGEAALRTLAQAQAAGALVINSPQAIRSCYRDRLGSILKQVDTPAPAGLIVETGARLDWRALSQLAPARGIYVKRGDLHALYDGDVRRAADEAAVAAVLGDFATRGIRLAYLQQAVEGRVVKFYGVSGPDYFSLADHDDLPPGPQFDGLHQVAQTAASALGLEVWGGDAIMNGAQFAIVDFNDWPSFERVRHPAAEAIARRALRKLVERK